VTSDKQEIAFDWSLFTRHLPLHFMYRKPRFLEMLHAIREEMSREADYDVDLFAEMVRSGVRPRRGAERNIRGYKSSAPGLDPSARVEEPRERGRRKRAAR
jgi:hypothetical protein